jgi:hypothetical protein
MNLLLNKESFFLAIFLIWYFKNDRLYLNNAFAFFNRTYINVIDFLTMYNSVLCSDIIDDDEINEINKKKKIEENNIIAKLKYEDKYLNEIQSLDKEYKFDEEIMKEKTEEFFQLLKKDYTSRLKEITDELYQIREDLIRYNYTDEHGNVIFLPLLTSDTKMYTLLGCQKEIQNEKKELKEYLASTEFEEENYSKAKELAKNFMIEQYAKKFINCHVIEYTPLGNVLMVYDYERETFKYYSDNNIPYRYLEVVARKYVKFFDCRPFYIDMIEELKLAEEREKEKDRLEKERSEKEKMQTIKTEEKKNVFAKFKNYNKEAGTGRVNIAVPPKNCISNVKTNENEKFILKDRANRYTYEGKFVNFNFIKKVDRKVVDRKQALTFKEFKILQI